MNATNEQTTLAMNPLEALKAKHAKELAELERESKIHAFIPHKGSVCFHRDHFSYSLHKEGYQGNWTFREALAIMEPFKPFIVVAEAWKDGCLHIAPAEINEYAGEEKHPNAVMEHGQYAEIRLNAGKGYDSHELRFYIRTPEGIGHVSIRLSPPWKWLPQVHTTYTQDGEVSKHSVMPKGIGEDKLNRWWNPPGSYQLSYSWADQPNFESWASGQLQNL